MIVFAVGLPGVTRLVRRRRSGEDTQPGDDFRPLDLQALAAAEDEEVN